MSSFEGEIGELQPGRLPVQILRGDTWKTERTHVDTLQFLPEGVVEFTAESLCSFADTLRDGDRVRMKLPGRVDIAVKRVLPETEKPISFVDGRIIFDTQIRSVLVEGEDVELTPMQFGILHLLARNAGSLVTKQEISKVIWGDSFARDKNITEHVSKSRIKLGDYGWLIRTVRGSYPVIDGGYIFDDVPPSEK